MMKPFYLLFTVLVMLSGCGGSGNDTSTATTSPLPTPSNTSPNFTSQSVSTREDTLFSGSITATDADGDSLTFTTTSASTNGSFMLNNDGSFTYTPNPNYVGSDTALVSVSDGKVSVEQAINFTITPVRSYFYVNDALVMLKEDTPYVGLLDLSNPQQQELSFTIATEPTYGELNVRSDGTFEYIPDEHYYGIDYALVFINTPTESFNIALDFIVSYLDDGPKIFDWAARQVWTGPELEGNISYCQLGAMRWDNIISSFDLNLDGKSDIILPISCYQQRLTREELALEKQHNNQVIAAWKLFCSSDTTQYSDCTKTVFKEDVIKATGNNYGGGNPYTHVWDAPKDLNGDGYPDIYYALNRDDSRPGFQPSDPNDAALLAEFCGERFTVQNVDCTRETQQSILMSNGDGTYRVAPMPWEPTNTQAVMTLKNADAGYDIIAFNYHGGITAARITQDNIINVTTEYHAYKNVEYLSTTSPYNYSFVHNGNTYAAIPEIPYSLVTNPKVDEDLPLQNFTQDDSATSEFTYVEHAQRMGFSLWRFEPTVGFHLVDTYQPNPEDTFYYKNGTAENYEMDFGSYVNGIGVFAPLWHFFEYVQLDDTEEPILVVQSEPKGMRVGEYLKAPVDVELAYQERGGVELETSMAPALSTIQAFYIRDEKLVEREQQIVDEGILMNMPGFQFDDLDLDGDMDMYGLPGQNGKGAVYRNDEGTLFRVNIEDAIPEITWTDDYDSQYAYAMRRLGKENKLSLIYWTTGFAYPDAFPWEKQTTPSDFGIVPGLQGIDVLETLTGEYINQRVAACLVNDAWFTGAKKCRFYF